MKNKAEIISELISVIESMCLSDIWLKVGDCEYNNEIDCYRCWRKSLIGCDSYEN